MMTENVLSSQFRYSLTNKIQGPVSQLVWLHWGRTRSVPELLELHKTFLRHLALSASKACILQLQSLRRVALWEIPKRGVWLFSHERAFSLYISWQAPWFCRFYFTPGPRKGIIWRFNREVLGNLCFKTPAFDVIVLQKIIKQRRGIIQIH